MSPVKKKTAKKIEPELAVEGQSTYLHSVEVGDQLLVARIDKWKGKESLDLRRFYKNGDDEKWHPTSKGVRIPMDSAQDFLQKALAGLEK